jgi:hypothetical protein
MISRIRGICSSSLTVSPSFYTYCYLYTQSYVSTPICVQFCGILYNHATCVVLLTFISYLIVCVLLLLCHKFLFCKHFCDPKHVHCHLTLNLLMTTVVAPPSNASKWQMGFNLAFKGLIYLG